MSSTTARAASDLSNALAILSDTTVSGSKRSETVPEIRQKATFLKLTKEPTIYKLFKDFTNYRKKTNREVVFGPSPLPNTPK